MSRCEGSLTLWLLVGCAASAKVTAPPTRLQTGVPDSAPASACRMKACSLAAPPGVLTLDDACMTMAIPADWSVQCGCGVDSLPGTVKDGAGRERMNFDVGGMAGNVALDIDSDSEIVDVQQGQVVIRWAASRVRFSRRRDLTTPCVGEVSCLFEDDSERAQCMTIIRSTVNGAAGHAGVSPPP